MGENCSGCRAGHDTILGTGPFAKHLLDKTQGSEPLRLHPERIFIRVVDRHVEDLHLVRQHISDEAISAGLYPALEVDEVATRPVRS